MAISALGKRQYMLIGKLLVNRHPDIANVLIKEISTDKPEQVDLALLPGYFNSFCELLNLNPSEYKGALKTTSKVDIRRLFISVMLHYYSPGSYHHPPDYITIRFGFTKAISEAMGIDIGLTSRFIREVISMEKIYEEYRDKVASTKQLLSNHKA